MTTPWAYPFQSNPSGIRRTLIGQELDSSFTSGHINKHEIPLGNLVLRGLSKSTECWQIESLSLGNRGARSFESRANEGSSALNENGNSTQFLHFRPMTRDIARRVSLSDDGAGTPFNDDSFHRTSLYYASSHILSDALQRQLQKSIGKYQHQVTHSVLEKVCHVSSLSDKEHQAVLGLLTCSKGTHMDAKSDLATNRASDKRKRGRITPENQPSPASAIYALQRYRVVSPDLESPTTPQPKVRRLSLNRQDPRDLGRARAPLEGHLEDRMRSKSDLDIARSDSGEFVCPEVRKDISKVVYLSMAQMKRCKVTEEDKIVKFKKHQVGQIGFCCKHCGGTPHCGRYFPTTYESFVLGANPSRIIAHVLRCPRMPNHIKKAVHHANLAERTEPKRLEYGSRKRFYSHVWEKLFGHESLPTSKSTKKG